MYRYIYNIWGSTASRLQSHYEERQFTFYHSVPGVPGTQLIDLGRMKG